MSCDTPNHSSSILDSYINESENKFNILSDTPDGSENSLLRTASSSTNDFVSNLTHQSSSSCRSSSIDLDSNPGSPLQQSSPIYKNRRRKNDPRPLKVLSVNLQSMNAKREAFWEAVESCNPDVIIANETWLKPSVLSSEMMPPGFNTPIRKDRYDSYGGVLLATRNDLIDCELKIKDDC